MLFKSKSEIFADEMNTDSLIDHKLEKLTASKQCKDLLKQLLIADSKRRINKTKFFEHPFVKTAPDIYKANFFMKSARIINDVEEESENYLSSSGSKTVFYNSSKDISKS